MEPKKPTKPNQTPRKVENGLVVTRGARGGGGWSGGPARFHRSSLDREPGCVPQHVPGGARLVALGAGKPSPPCCSVIFSPFLRLYCPIRAPLCPFLAGSVPAPWVSTLTESLSHTSRPPSAGKVRSAGRGCRKEHPAQLPSWSVPPSQAGDRLQSDQGLPVSLLLVQKSGHMCSASASLSSPSAPFWLVRVGLGQAFRIPEQYGLRLGCGLGEGGGVADLLWLRSQDPRRQWDQPSSPESSRTRMSYPQLPEDLTRLAV